MCSCSLLFSLPLIFTLVAASISHFLDSAVKFFFYEIVLRCVYISRSRSFSVIHVNINVKI